MTPQDKIKLAIRQINNIRALQPSDEPICISVYDLPSDIQGKIFANILTKLEQEYEAINILSLPYDLTGNDYNPISDESHTAQNSYTIELTEGYDSMCKNIFMAENKINQLPKYVPYYIQLMFQCIEEEKITDDNQPKKVVLENWFRKQNPPLSEKDIQKLATFVRNPEKRAGGWQHEKKKGDD